MNSKVEDKNSVRVGEMFDQISVHYDMLNKILSLGIDRIWRKKAIRIAANQPHQLILDVASGTGDMSILASKLDPGLITAIDISRGMLEIQNRRILKKQLGHKIKTQVAKAENLPFNDNSFDLATCAFGVRNFEDTVKGLSEIYRVVKPGGTFIILEFSHPKGAFSGIFLWYFRTIIPLIGRIISKNKQAYQYLPDTVDEFPSGYDFLKLMHQVGFENTSFQSLSGNIATIYTGKKK